MLTTSFPRFEGDSAGIFVYHLARALVDAGTGVEVVAPWDAGSELCEEANGIRIHRFKYSPWSRLNIVYGGGGIPEKVKDNPGVLSALPLLTLSFTARAVEIARDCHVVHAQWLYSGLVAGTLRKFLRVPSLLTLRGSDMKYMQSSKMLQPAARLIFSSVDRVTSVSLALEESARRIGLRKDRIETIPNGVDLSLFSPMPQQDFRSHLGLPPDKRIILFVGNLTENKGLHPLLKAFQTVHRSRKDVLLALVGQGLLEAELQGKALEYGLKEHVLFAGIQAQNRLPYWYNSADLLVLPSYSEGRPNVVLESMACGTPVAASDIPGIRELGGEEEDFRLFRPGEAADMAEAIIKIINGDVKVKAGAELRQRLVDRGLTWEMCAQRYIRCYRRIRGEE